MVVFFIAVLWVCGIIGATFYSYKRDDRRNNKGTSKELMETIITQNNYPPMGEILAWSKTQNISADYKGMLQ